MIWKVQTPCKKDDVIQNVTTDQRFDVFWMVIRDLMI